MPVTEQERTTIDTLKSRGYKSIQIVNVIKELRRRDELARAQAESEEKYEKEKARIEAERKAAKEKEATDTALEKSFTFQTGVEPEEEVEPIGMLAPEVEKTAKEKNTELVDQNAAEND